MKQRMQQLAKKIDALTLRERVILFVGAAAVLVYLVNFLLIDPQFAKQKMLAEQIRRDQAQMQEFQTLISQRIKAHALDPDAENRMRLQALKQRQTQLQENLQDMQKGLVSPDKMVGLLEDLLKRQGKLQLVGLKTLPVTGLKEDAAVDPKAPASSTAPATKGGAGNPADADLIYKHGVEITLQGSYLDILDYMSELEKMPWQVFWGKARLEVDTYPRATITLTLFTLSLDKKWLNL